MRSFALTALAFLTLGAFSAAAPTPYHGDDVGLIDVDADVHAGVDILKRGSSSHGKTLDAILDGVVSEVDGIISEISESDKFRIPSLVLLT